MLRVGSDIYNPEDQLKTLESPAILETLLVLNINNQNLINEINCN